MANSFASFDDAQQKIDAFRWDYNEHRPHRALKGSRQVPRLENCIDMEPNELLAKATIAAALIASHAVDMSQLPKAGTPDVATRHLRELTNYVYAAIIGSTAA